MDPANQLNRQARTQKLHEALRQRVLVLDGAMGTAIQALDLSEKDFGGAEYFGCNEHLVLTLPTAIERIHLDYLRAGADIIETNTFGATPLVLNEFSLGAKAYEINVAAAHLAARVAQAESTSEKPRFVAGSIGPTTKAISVTGGITFSELMQQFYEQALGLIDGGVDFLLIETCQDTRNVKAALLGIDQAMTEQKTTLPIAVSCTIEPMGTMLAGQAIDAFYTALEHRDLLYIGLNCATGPQFMTDHIRTLAQMSKTNVACVPNAGLPDEDGHYLETPQMMANVLRGFGEKGWLNLIGGCCGTTALHISAFAALARDLKPRLPVIRDISTLSGIEYLEVTDEKRPILVGERTNVIGSRKFKDLIYAGAFEEAGEVARAQVKRGAHVIDICMANPDRDENADMERFMAIVVNKVKVPLVLDSTDADVFAAALPYCQGKALLNSINLEDGEERFEKVVPLAKKYGAALVVGCIDEDPEQGMGVTKERKLAIAQRSYTLLTQKYDVLPQDIYFDALVFPCGTGDQQYVGSAPETIEGIRLIKESFPKCKTVLGISNVSFGLPEAGREVLNSVFLYHCTKAGLDLAIVNSEKLQRYPSIPEAERLLAEDLLWNRGAACLTRFSDHFRAAKKAAPLKSSLPLDKRLGLYIIEGSKDGLIADLDLALQKQKPLEIINGPLMAGMEEVGRLFNSNQLIVAEVLQSAEAMKAAVAYLEKFMEKADAGVKAKVILATVKGDVHDIGKNLVEIILNNNGFDVINLGIKVAPEQLIAAVRQHRPDIVGLSGLLVKSAQQMVVTAEDMKRAGIETPVLVGGAALSRNFVDKRIAPAYAGLVEYAKDAMTGLELTRRIVNPARQTELISEVGARRRDLATAEANDATRQTPASQVAAKPVRQLTEFPQPSDFRRHALRDVALDEIWSYINPLMLYGKHLGMKGSVVKKLMARHMPQTSDDAEIAKARQIEAVVDEVKVFCRQGKMQPRAVYQFYRAASVGNAVHLYSESDFARPLMIFNFPRQTLANQNGLCIADFVAPLRAGKPVDNLCMFVVTAGEGILQFSQEFKEAGDYLKSHALQALAVETAEAFAELLHAKLRSIWGFPDAPELTMMERFQAKYRGCRYSFGYPACPDLQDQEKLFDLLKPADIGVQLTEGFMMEPEASVSAIVLHHPDADYFGVGGIE